MMVLTGQDEMILAGGVEPVHVDANNTMSSHEDRVRYVWITEEAST